MIPHWLPICEHICDLSKHRSQPSRSSLWLAHLFLTVSSGCMWCNLHDDHDTWLKVLKKASQMISSHILIPASRISFHAQTPGATLLCTFCPVHIWSPSRACFGTALLILSAISNNGYLYFLLLSQFLSSLIILLFLPISITTIFYISSDPPRYNKLLAKNKTLAEGVRLWNASLRIGVY